MEFSYSTKSCRLFHRIGSSGHAYGSITRGLTNRMTGTIGLRYDGQDLTEVDANTWSGRLAFDYRISPAWRIDLDLGRYNQPQFLHEIQIDEGLVELDPPQHADQLKLGLAWSASSRLTLRGDIYARRVVDPWPWFDNLYNRLVLLPELSDDRYLIEASEARSRGIELAASYGGSRLSWKLVVAHSNAQERIAGAWHNRSWDQPFSAKAHLAWIGADWRLGVNATYRSGWPATPLVTGSAQLPAVLGTERLPSYWSLDMHVARVFETRRGRLEVYGDITNATNRSNVAGYLYDPELTRDDVPSLPIVPSIGIRWSW